MIRGIDMIVAAVLVVVLSPVLGLCAVAVVVDSGFPILYRARRVGLDGAPIDVLKFRSMRPSPAGPLITVGGDDRITRVGAILRASKLDELPQLVNVLRGEMSLVGPRPEDPKYVELFKDEFAHVLSVRPGITGAASVAFRNESEILAGQADPQSYYVNTLLPQKLELERQYVAGQSVWTNLSLLARTVRALFKADQQ